MRRIVASLVACAGIAGGLCAERSAPAQTPSASVTVATVASSTAPAPTGDASYSAPLSGAILAAPLRLSLEGSVFPVAARFPQCSSLGDDVGNSVGGIPVQHYTEVRLTPRLVLSGFSQLGCPIDAGIGAAFTYSVPVARSTWLVFGGGGYVAPGQLPLYGGMKAAVADSIRGRASPVQAAARTDIVWKGADGNPYHLGVQSNGRGRQLLMFGGGF